MDVVTKDLTKKENQKSRDIIIDELNRLVDRSERESYFLDEIMRGDVPDFMCTFRPINIELDDYDWSLTIFVSPDYLCIGTDDYHLRVPLWPITAQVIFDRIDCIMPTTKIVDEIVKRAHIHLEPMPWGPPYDSTMMSSYRIIEHNERIERQLSNVAHDLSCVVCGHKKDVVICNKLFKSQQQVAIYGWHKKDGETIQPLYLGHENTYSDYSHGIRLIDANATLVNRSTGARASCRLEDIYVDCQDHAYVSVEGPMKLTKQPIK